MALVCHTHFEKARTERFQFNCDHEPVVYTFNGIGVCDECKPLVKEAYNNWTAARDAERAACPDCTAQREESRAKAQAEYDNRKCGYCGKPPSEDLDVQMHSGVYECGKCWGWRKLDGPAARYWNERTKHLIQNFDMHDARTFLPKKVGLSEAELKTFLDVARKIIDSTDAMLKEHS